MKYWIVEASYYGFDPLYDDKLEKLVGQTRSGSGAGFGARDIDWTFTSMEAAAEAAARLKTEKNGKRNLRVDIVEHDDGE